MLTVMAKEFFLQLSLIFRELFQQLLEFLFPDRLAEHHRPGSMDEVVPFEIEDLEAAYHGRFTETESVKGLLINLIANIILSFLHKMYLKTFLHFIGYDFSFLKRPHF